MVLILLIINMKDVKTMSCIKGDHSMNLVHNPQKEIVLILRNLPEVNNIILFLKKLLIHRCAIKLILVNI